MLCILSVVRLMEALLCSHACRTSSIGKAASVAIWYSATFNKCLNSVVGAPPNDKKLSLHKVVACIYYDEGLLDRPAN